MPVPGAAMPLPLDVLEDHVDRELFLRLKDGRTLEGTLTGFDQYMNLVLEDVEESHEGSQRRLGKVVLRGNNIVSVMPK